MEEVAAGVLPAAGILIVDTDLKHIPLWMKQ
jgi:hypothetical protein